MDLGMTEAAGQAMAMTGMLGRCRIDDPKTATIDPLTGAPSYGTPLAAGVPCRVRQTGTRPLPADGIASTHIVESLQVHLPVDLSPWTPTHAQLVPPDGAIITITSHATRPPLVGRRYRVVGEHLADLQTAMRIAVERVVGP